MSRRFNTVNQGAVPGCTVVGGQDYACAYLDAGIVSLPPGVWEVTAQVWVDSSANGFLQDNRREVTCKPQQVAPWFFLRTPT